MTNSASDRPRFLGLSWGTVSQLTKDYVVPPTVRMLLYLPQVSALCRTTAGTTRGVSMW